MKTPTQNIVETLRGKKVLFIENDSSLANGLDDFQKILRSNDIEHKCLFNLSDIDIELVKQEINNCDAIVFQTQWVTELSKKLFQYIKLLPKKIVVEVYINEPTWFYASQHGSKHDVYIYSSEIIFKEETFYKLTDKAYWDYKNGFDK